MATAPLEALRFNVKSLPKIAAPAATKTAPIATSPTAHAGATSPVTVTRAQQGQGDGTNVPTRRSAHADRMDAVFGGQKVTDPVVRDRNEVSVKLMTPSEAREHVKRLDARKAAQQS